MPSDLARTHAEPALGAPGPRRVAGKIAMMMLTPRVWRIIVAIALLVASREVDRLSAWLADASRRLLQE